MKKNFAKKLATVLSMALVVASVAPVTASAATAPDLKARRATVYEGKYYSYAATNVKGYSVKWSVSGEGAEFAALSNKTGANTYLSVETDGDLAAKNADLKLTAKFYKDGVLKQTRVDNVVIKVSATDVAISTTADTNFASVGDKIDFNRTLKPANSTSKTYWKVLDKDNKEVAGAIDAQGVFTVSKLGQYKVVAEVRNAKDAVLRATDEMVVVAANTVASATPINATQVEVKFAQPVDKTDATTITSNLFTINGNPATAVTLSADGKTATVTFASATVVEVTNGVLVVNPIKTATDTSVTTDKYTKVFTYSDTVRPVANPAVSYTDYQHAQINFSEPMQSLTGTVTASNSKVLVSSTGAIDLSDPALAEGTYTITIVGAKDMGDNLISPNPTVLTVVKSKTDTVKPAVVGITSSSTTKLTVQFTEKLATNPVVTVSGSATTVAVDSTDNTKYNVTISPAVSGIQLVSVAADYVDPSGNKGDAYSTLVQFTADTTAPTYVSHEVKTFNNAQYLVVTYNEDVAYNTGVISGSYVDSSSITRTASLGGVATNLDNNTKTVEFSLASNVAGNYNVTIPAALVKDTSSNANVSAATTLSFSLGTVANTTKPSVSGVEIQVSDANKVTVTFDASKPAPTATSALNPNNYTVEGQTVFTSAILDGSANKVTLTLAEGTVSVNGLRNFAINNIVGTNGSTMDVYTSPFVFYENVKPYITAAKLTAGNTIKLTFSEDVNYVSTADFEVYINGTKVASSVAADGTITLTDVAHVVTSFSDVVTVKVLPNNDITDKAVPANALKVVADTITVTR